MNKKIVSILTVSAITLSLMAGCGSSNNGATNNTTSGSAETVESSGNDNSQSSGKKSNADENLGTKKVGVCIYQGSDTFMGLLKDELVAYLINQGFSEDNISVYDGQADQSVQDGQIAELITAGVDVLIVNPVNASSAASITDLAVGAGIPLVYINREPDAKEEQRWTDKGWDVTYVGSDARQSGTLQGDIIVDLGLENVDFNGDKVVQYAMIEGDPENIDSEYRTTYSVKALGDAGWDAKEVYNNVANFDKDQAKPLVAEALASHPEIEVVFCNNDAMALGALEAIEEAGRTVGTDIYLVGVDALQEALDCILQGRLTGTVFNDYYDQSHRAGQAAINYIKGVGNDHYIGCDYVKVTADNAQELLDAMR